MKISDKEKIPSLTKYIIFSISITILYTIVDIVLECYDIHLPDQLTKCVYGFFAGEVVICGLIKTFKIHKEIKLAANLPDDDSVG